MTMLRVTKLQAALLQCISEGGDNPVSLEAIHRRVYRIANKKIPKTSLQAVAAMVRATTKKIKPLRCQIVRVTPLGAGFPAAYVIKGNVPAVQEAIAEYRKVFPDAE